MKKILVFVFLIGALMNVYSQIETEFFFMYLKPTYSQDINSSFFSDDIPGIKNESGSFIINNRLKKTSFSAGLLFKFPFSTYLEIRSDFINSEGNFRSNFNIVSLSGMTKSFIEDNNSGRLMLMPVSLNIHFKLLKLWRFSSYISGGLSFFTGKFKANTNTYMTLSYYEEDDLYNNDNAPVLRDLWRFDIRTDSSISGMGGNLGGGIKLKVLKRVSVYFEARYFKGPSKTITWEVISRQYYSEVNNSVSHDTILNDAVDMLNSRYPVKIKTEFYYYAGGIKIAL